MFVPFCGVGHVKWCDRDPCFSTQGGVCLYQEYGKSYSCQCLAGYQPVYHTDNPALFKRCEGVTVHSSVDSSVDL